VVLVVVVVFVVVAARRVPYVIRGHRNSIQRRREIRRVATGKHQDQCRYSQKPPATNIVEKHSHLAAATTGNHDDLIEK
jgi:Sec-independent protein translocase protein TatA